MSTTLLNFMVEMWSAFAAASKEKQVVCEAQASVLKSRIVIRRNEEKRKMDRVREEQVELEKKRERARVLAEEAREEQEEWERLREENMMREVALEREWNLEQARVEEARNRALKGQDQVENVHEARMEVDEDMVEGEQITEMEIHQPFVRRPAELRISRDGAESVLLQSTPQTFPAAALEHIPIIPEDSHSLNNARQPQTKYEQELLPPPQNNTPSKVPPVPLPPPAKTTHPSHKKQSSTRPPPLYLDQISNSNHNHNPNPNPKPKPTRSLPRPAPKKPSSTTTSFSSSKSKLNHPPPKPSNPNTQTPKQKQKEHQKESIHSQRLRRQAAKTAAQEARYAAVRIEREKMQEKKRVAEEKERERIARVRAKVMGGGVEKGKKVSRERDGGIEKEKEKGKEGVAAGDGEVEMRRGRACGKCGGEHRSVREWKVCGLKNV